MFRRWRRIGALAASLLLCLPLHILWQLSGCASPWPRRFLGMAARAVGVRTVISGTPCRVNVFFAANHLSWIDILVLAGTTGTSFIAHDGIEQWPVVGWLAAQNNTIFIAREKRHAVGNQVNQLRAALTRDQPVTLFPEGTTNDGGALLPFRPALFAGLMPPPRALQIQPIYIDYGPAAADIAWFGNEGAGANARRVLARSGPLVVTLHFLEPLDPANYPDRKAVAAETQKRIETRKRTDSCVGPFVPASPPV
jgi:1-acyl-sn-glycerol-3-phosphate acyltransferase